MNDAYSPKVETIVFVWLFFTGYFWFLLRQAIKNRMDVFDFLLLLAIALVPTLFVSLPRAATAFSRLLGVQFPFVVLFGILNFILFLMVLQLIRRTNKLKKGIIELTQSLALRYEEKDP